MIGRSVSGLKDARRCSYLGELDSEEESDEISNEFEFSHEITAIPDGHYANYSIATSPTTRTPAAANHTTSSQYLSYLEHFQRLPDRQKQGLVKKLLEALREDPKSEENLVDAVQMTKFRAFQVREPPQPSDGQATPKFDIRTKRSEGEDGGDDMGAEDNGGEILDEEGDTFDLSDFPEDVIYDLLDQGEFNMETPNDKSREEVNETFLSLLGKF